MAPHGVTGGLDSVDDASGRVIERFAVPRTGRPDARFRQGAGDVAAFDRGPGPSLGPAVVEVGPDQRENPWSRSGPEDDRCGSFVLTGTLRTGRGPPPPPVRRTGHARDAPVTHRAGRPRPHPRIACPGAAGPPLKVRNARLAEQPDPHAFTSPPRTMTIRLPAETGDDSLPTRPRPARPARPDTSPDAGLLTCPPPSAPRAYGPRAPRGRRAPVPPRRR